MSHHNPQIARRSATLLAATVLAAAGCLGDDRCSSGQRLEGPRCVAIRTPDAGAKDSDPDDGSAPDKGAPDTLGSTDADGAAGCAFAPAAADLLGAFQQLGKVGQSTCPIPLPRPGDDFDAEVTFSVDAEDKLQASIKTAVATVEGEPAIGPDGKVNLTAQGKLLEFTLTVTLVYCFSDADTATTEVTVALDDANGPLCEFEAPGSLSRL